MRNRHYERLVFGVLAAVFIFICFSCGGGGDFAVRQRGAALTPEQRAAADRAKAESDALKKQESDLKDRILSVATFAKDNVRRFLEHPNDASFGLWDEPDAKFSQEQDTFWLSSKVKAKNDLGKDITYQWEAIIMFDGKTDELAFCAIDGQTVYTSGALLDKIIATEQRRTEAARVSK